MAHHTLDTTALREPFPEDDASASVQLRWKPVRALDLFYGALRPAVAFVSFPEDSITLDRIMVRYAMAGPCRGMPPPALRHGQASPRASATERATAPRLEPASAHSSGRGKRHCEVRIQGWIRARHTTARPRRCACTVDSGWRVRRHRRGRRVRGTNGRVAKVSHG